MACHLYPLYVLVVLMIGKVWRAKACERRGEFQSQDSNSIGVRGYSTRRFSQQLIGCM